MKFRHFIEYGTTTPGQQQPFTGDARAVLPHLKALNAKNPGKLKMSLVDENKVALQKIRQLALNVHGNWHINDPNAKKYVGVSLIDVSGKRYERGDDVPGIENIKWIVGISDSDIERGEGGRQFLSSQEVLWAKQSGLFRMSSEPDKAQLWDLDIPLLRSMLSDMRNTMDYDQRSGMFRNALDRMVSIANQGSLSPTTNFH